MTTFVLLALVACNHKATDTTDSGSGTGTLDTGTGTAFQGNSYTGFVHYGPDETTDGIHAVVALVQVQNLHGPAVAGATIASAPVSGGGVFTVNLPDTPSASQIVDLSPDFPGTKAAIYMPMITDDTNGDLAFSDGETVVGVNLDLWLMYVDPTGTVPSGWPTGWTLVNPHYGTTDAPEFTKIGAEGQITFRGSDAKAYTIGSWAGMPTDKNYGVIVMDNHWWTDGTMPTSHPSDAPLTTGSFSMILSVRPPGEQFYKDDPRGVWYMLANLLVYQDAELNGKFDDTDPMDGSTVCMGTVPLQVRYVIPPTTLSDGIALELNGWTAGWHAMLSTTGQEFSHDDTKHLTIDPATCKIALPSSAR